MRGRQIQKLDCQGTLAENCIDVSMLINGIYSMMIKSQPSVAKLFREAIAAAVSDDKSPVWKPEDYDGITIVGVKPRDEHVDCKGYDEEEKENDKR